MIKLNLQVTMRSIHISKYSEGADFSDPRRIKGDQYHPVLVKPIALGVGNTHHYGNPASGISRPTAPPLASVDNVVVSTLSNGALYIGGIAGCYGRLRHAEARTYLASQERLKPHLFLLVAAIEMEDFHIALGIKK